MSVHVAGILEALNVQQRLSRSFVITVLIVIGYSLVYMLSKGTLGEGPGGFPESIRVPIQRPIDAFFDFVSYEVAWLTAPFASAVDSTLAGFETFFLWIPWAVLLAITGLLALRLAGLLTAVFALSSLTLIGVWGLWDSTMITLSLMGVSVLFAIAIAVPLGVAAALSTRMDSALRPILDVMQVLPAFVYFMPALFLFGVGGTVAVSLTVIYALPLAIRLTNLGIRRVPTETIETALSHGSTRLQTLFQVQLPLAKPTIMMGISQTIMMALAMVIMTGLIGSSGLGRDIVTALRTINSGAGLEAGLAIVFIAIIFDRLCYGLVRDGRVTSSTVANGRAGAADVDSKGIGRFPGGVSYLTGLVSLVVLGTLISLVTGTADFPRVLEYSVAGAVNDAVGWAAVHLYFATDWIKENLMFDLLILEFFEPGRGIVSPLGREDAPLWDLTGKIFNEPVWRLLGGYGPATVPVYDGSIYFSDLDPEYRDRGIHRILEEIDYALELGHRAFKIKVGRGYQWMPSAAGLTRDIQVVRAIRSHVGPDIKLMVDSNNGYDLATTKRFLE